MLLSCLLNFSCSSIPDVPVCVQVNPGKAFCTYTIQDKDFFIDDNNLFEAQTYWDIKPTMIQVPYKSWVELKKFILIQCKRSNCTNNYSQKIDTIESNVNQK